MKKRRRKKKPATRRRLGLGKSKAKLSSGSLPDLIDAMREERIRELAQFAK